MISIDEQIILLLVTLSSVIQLFPTLIDAMKGSLNGKLIFHRYLSLLECYLIHLHRIHSHISTSFFLIT